MRQPLQQRTNQRDEQVAWVAEMSRVTRWTTEAPYARDTDWAAVVAGAARGRLVTSTTAPELSRSMLRKISGAEGGPV